MQKIKFVLFSLLLVSTQIYAAIGANPFDRSVKNTIGTNVPWQYKDDTAFKVSQDSMDSDTYYHLVFDGKSLRLSLSSSNADSPQDARHFDQFAVNDVKIDGKRMPLFQWCLSHQEKHDRFLQQGLAVDSGICENRGENGTFIMKLNPETLKELKTGKNLSFAIKPFRTMVVVNYSLADFSAMATRVLAEQAPAKPVKETSAPSASETVARVCTVKPPAGFEKIKPITYTCDSVSDEASANKSMNAEVSRIEKERAAEKAKKQQAELAKKKKEEEALRKLQLQQQQEAAAIAASKVKREQLNKEITVKMVAMCKKMWSRGESRCYCEKYIDQAPPGIKPNPDCKTAKE